MLLPFLVYWYSSEWSCTTVLLLFERERSARCWSARGRVVGCVMAPGELTDEVIRLWRGGVVTVGSRSLVTLPPSVLREQPIKASLLPDAESLQTPSASSLPLCSTHLSLCQSIPPSLPPAPLQITATSSPPFLVLPSSEFPLLSFSSLARTPGMWLEQRDDIVGEDGRETGSVQDQCSQIWMWKLSIFTAWFLMLLGNNFKILATKLNEKFKNIFFLGGGLICYHLYRMGIISCL